MPIDFKKLLSARFLYTFAVYMQAVILGWRIYDLLKDPLYLGFIGLAEAIPALGLALYAGYLVDRARPLRVYRWVIYISLLSGLVVLGEHIFADQLSRATQAALLYLAAFFTGVARSFSQPSMFASLPHLVERNMIVKAMAVSSASMQVARILGPACGGIIYGFYGVIAASSTICIFLIGASLVMLLIRKDIPAPEMPLTNMSVKAELLSGVVYVFKHPILLPALSLDMISVLFGGVTALLPIFAQDILLVGPKGLGALRAAPAVGAALMGIFLTQSNKMRTGKWLLTAVTGFGISILVFGLSENFYLSLFALTMSGVFDSISVVIRMAAVQLSSPAHMRGKIAAVNSVFIGSSNELGEVESGIAAKFLGTVPAVYLGGIVCLLTVGCVAYFSPTLRNMDLERVPLKH